MDATIEADQPHPNGHQHLRHLSVQHLAQLRASGIADDVIEARGYFSANREELIALGFAPYQARAGLVLPALGIDRQSYQLRPDNPRVIRRKDKPPKTIKYETPAGSGLLIDIHWFCREWVGDQSVPIIASEGIKKLDAALSAARREGVKVLTLGLAGVWSWRNKEEGPLSDWEYIRLDGRTRTLYIVFDSDVITKSDVQKALKRLTNFLKGRGANVKICYLPPGPPGPDGKPTKVGLDDYLAAGHTLAEVFALASDRVRDSETNVSDDGVRSCFRLTETAVLYKSDEDDDWEFVCSRLEIVASTRDAKGDDWGRLLVFTDSDGRKHEWSMPMSMLAGDGIAYRERLLSLGLIIGAGKKARERLHMYISTTIPKARARSASRLGWHGRNYLFADEVVYG